jgi:flagellar hook-basal body complex protein FliE
VGSPLASGSAAAPTSFASLLQQGIKQVDQAQKTAASAASAFEQGVPGMELPQVMLELQKANVSLRAMTEVRNRFVSAYQEIMNMPI